MDTAPVMTDFAALNDLVMTGGAANVVPHRVRYRAVAECPDGVEYRLVSNWPRKRWFLIARRGEWRHGHMRSTSSPARAEQWLRLFAPDALREQWRQQNDQTATD